MTTENLYREDRL